MHEPVATTALPPIRIGGWFQGPSGSGNGGWTAHRFASRLPTPVTTSIRSPIPLDTDLYVRAIGDGWELAEGLDAAPMMSATPWTPAGPTTDPISIDEAIAARSRFEGFVPTHPVPSCFSCGLQPGSMGVHAGPLGDDRVATDWQPPEWAVNDDGTIDGGALWAALDCCSAWWVGFTREPRVAYTVQYAVEELETLSPDETYALVAWAGDHGPEWDGRKRHAASAAFDVDGRCVARSVSLWVAARTD